eukprot:gnl/TRDRNA2_/TRDRNA2_186448_c0_seq1.p1 gnl/TRDRNA2_/TRDRNA2_186448_c0~~gnl/TRDRNA2_/TRDRNA2_186448_c0_seq1.p1  ORF type:complete len:357 (+),score=33.96 gnl/TRDRNA2_/TRDRNA2_186448_c0_seq1:206-1276(+)
MSLPLRLLMSIADQIQNIGQLVEICQNHVYHEECCSMHHRSIQMDAQSLRLDVLDHAKEEIRSHYDSYMRRSETVLLVTALLWPFALSFIQFSDPFIPATQKACPDCIEVHYQWLVGIWIALMGIVLVLPFWGILMLIRYQQKLAGWLEYSLGRLNRERQKMAIVKAPPPEPPLRTSISRSFSSLSLSNLECDHEKEDDEEEDNTEQLVCRLVNIVTECQECLAKMWTAECGWLIKAATRTLWISSYAGLLIAALSVWIFLVNSGGVHAILSGYFSAVIVLGCVGPLIYVMHQRINNRVEPPAPGEFEDMVMARSQFPLTTSFRDLGSTTQMRRSSSSPDLNRHAKILQLPRSLEA